MPDSSESPTTEFVSKASVRWLRPTAVAAGSTVVTTAALVLVGWAFGIDRLISITSHFNTMKPNTAVCFILTGVAIIRRARSAGGRDAVSAACAALSLAISGLTLLQYFIGADLGIDRVLLPESAVTPEGLFPGRMAPATATAHMCAALATLVLARAPARRFMLSELLAGVTGTLGLTALLGYLFDVHELYRFKPFASVALHTSLLFVVMSVGTLALSPHHAIVRVLTSPYLGGRLARRLLCYSILAPVAINWIAVRTQLLGAFGGDVTMAVTTVVGVLATSLVVLATAAWINRSDEARQALLRQQSMMMRELDHRVKNNLASVLALTSLTINNAETLDDFRDSFVGRIRALARTHEALAASRWEGVRLLDVVRLTIGPYAGFGRRPDRRSGAAASGVTSPHERLVVEGPDVMLPAVISSSVCASLHELATNAAKYGAFKHGDGQVRLTWTVSPDGLLDLVWQETGVPSISKPAHTGFGTEMIKGAVVHEMQGSVEFDYAPPGLQCRIRAPIVREKGRASLKTESA